MPIPATIKIGTIVRHSLSARVLFLVSVDEAKGMGGCREMSNKGRPQGPVRSFPLSELAIVDRRPISVVFR